MATVSAITEQAAITLQNAEGNEKQAAARQKELQFLNIVSDVTAEIELTICFKGAMTEATKMLNADRATLFLNDFKTEELFSRVAMGDGVGEIRLPNNVGIAGTYISQKRQLISRMHMQTSVLIPHLTKKLDILRDQSFAYQS